VAAAAERRKSMAGLMQRWSAIKAQDLTQLNTQLKQAGVSEVTVE
jgi:hypothetical protein